MLIHFIPLKIIQLKSVFLVIKQLVIVLSVLRQMFVLNAIHTIIIFQLANNVKSAQQIVKFACMNLDYVDIVFLGTI